ncbi:MAG: SWIB/MDM2 domain-containing protein [Gemmatimonadaceae bacterium]
MRNSDLNSRVKVSRELATIVGRGPHTRVSVTRRLWKYIAENGLQLKFKPPMAIQPDAALAAVVGTRRILNMNEMTELVNRHLSPDASTKAAPTSKRPQRAGERKRLPSAGHWLWVTKPEFYEHEDGSSAISVGPEEGWWTCSRETKAGDLALMYRAKTRKDIAYLILATTDAFSILEDPFAQEYGWEWACEYDVLYEFVDPVPLSVLRANKEFWDWPALRINFQGRVFEMPEPYWGRLIQLALPSNPGLAKFVGIEPGFSPPQRIRAERDLEDSLAVDLKRLRKIGWDLELWKDPATGRSGRQFVCAAAGGRIDLLCRDRASGQLVIVELKNVLATEATYMQTWRYLSWVQRFLADGKPVSALVVARGCDSRFELMAEASERKVRFLSLRDVGFE